MRDLNSVQTSTCSMGFKGSLLLYRFVLTHRLKRNNYFSILLHLRPMKERKGAFLGNPLPKSCKFRNEKRFYFFLVDLSGLCLYFEWAGALKCRHKSTTISTKEWQKNFFGQFIHWDKIFEFFSSTKAEWGISIIYLNHSHLS